jgi:hypothetical protein
MIDITNLMMELKKKNPLVYNKLIKMKYIKLIK